MTLTKQQTDQQVMLDTSLDKAATMPQLDPAEVLKKIASITKNAPTLHPVTPYEAERLTEIFMAGEEQFPHNLSRKVTDPPSARSAGLIEREKSTCKLKIDDLEVGVKIATLINGQIQIASVGDYSYSQAIVISPDGQVITDTLIFTAPRMTISEQLEIETGKREWQKVSVPAREIEVGLTRLLANLHNYETTRALW